MYPLYVYISSTTAVYQQDCLNSHLCEHHKAYLCKLYPYMPPVNCKRIQQQNYRIVCGVNVYLRAFVALTADHSRK
jgi:hypothetical protein